MGALAFSALLVAGAGFYLFSKALPNFRPGNKKIQRDLQEMKQKVNEEMRGKLIPLNKDDLELLSTQEAQHSSRKRITRNSSGVFTSIFEEHMFAYAFRRYLSNRRDALLYAATQRRDFHYWIKGEEVRIVIDDQPLGTYRAGVLTGSRSDKPIAQIDFSKQEGYPIRIQDRTVANLSTRYDQPNDGVSQRAFEFVANELSPEEEAILIALTIYELVNSRVKEE